MVSIAVIASISCSCQLSRQVATTIPDEKGWWIGLADSQHRTQIKSTRDVTISDGDVAVILRFKEVKRGSWTYIDAREIEVIVDSSRYRLPAEIGDEITYVNRVSDLVNSAGQLKFVVERGSGEYSYTTVVRISLSTMEVRVDDWHAVHDKPVATLFCRLQPL